MVKTLELKIRITPENSEKVIRLIREIVGSEEILKIGRSEPRITANEVTSCLGPPPKLSSLRHGKIVLSGAAEYVGTWGQFNSFFPIKAVLRVLSNVMSENNTSSINLQVLVDESIKSFKKARLKKFRGFPKHYRKESSIGRLVWHFMTTAHEIGLISLEGMDNIPTSGWDEVYVSVTKEGYEFASLENQILDLNGKQQILTKEEGNWLIDYLRKIDNLGFKEYSTLKGVYEELQKGNTHIAGWFEKNDTFSAYLRSWSKKKDDPTAFARQLETLSTTFAQSKIALLRELRIVQNKRNNFTILNPLR